MEPIPARRRVIEYTGERIDAAEMDRRAGKKLLYLFSVSENRIIDGAVAIGSPWHRFRFDALIKARAAYAAVRNHFSTP